MSDIDFAVTGEEVREACKAYNIYDPGEQEMAMHAALSKVLNDRRAAATLAPAAPSGAIGMRDGVYVNCTPQLHVGDSAFEDWFQRQPFATQNGIKQISRDSYAAGMGDPLVAESFGHAQPIAYINQADAQRLILGGWGISIVNAFEYTDGGHVALCLAGSQRPGFRVSVNPLKASNGVTYVVCIDAPNGERITPMNRNDVSEANAEAEDWSKFFGPALSAPFVPCEAIADGALVNTVPQYGSVVQDLTTSAGMEADTAHEVTKLRQALVYVAHALRPAQQMLPRGISLVANNGVIVALNGWHLSVVEDAPVVPGKVYGWMIAQTIAQERTDLADQTHTAPTSLPGMEPNVALEVYTLIVRMFRQNEAVLRSMMAQDLCRLLELGPNAKDAGNRAAHIAAAAKAIAKDADLGPAPSSAGQPPAGIPGWMNYSSRIGAMTSDENGVHLRPRQFSITDMGLNQVFTMPHGVYDLYAYPAGQQPAQFVSETLSMTAGEHKAKLARVETLIALNPAVESPEGRELSQLATEIERFEISVYGDLASPASEEPRRLFIVMNEQGSQGVVFDHRADATWTLTGEGVGSDGFGYPTLGESFRECYPDGLTLHELGAGAAAAPAAELKGVS